MKRLVEYEFEDGGSLLVEVDDLAPTGMRQAARGAAQAVSKAKQTFDATIDQVYHTAAVIAVRFRDMIESPDEVSMDFGIKMSLQGGIVVASAGAEANFKIALKWKKKD